jgi:hypothetical protein
MFDCSFTELRYASGDHAQLAAGLRSETNKLAGEYHWLPAFKDERLGTFEGRIDDQLISASYEYTQEGRSQIIPITIRLEPGRAIVEGGPAESGLGATIRQVDCLTGRSAISD